MSLFPGDNPPELQKQPKTRWRRLWCLTRASTMLPLPLGDAADAEQEKATELIHNKTTQYKYLNFSNTAPPPATRQWSYGYDLVLVSTGTDRNITLIVQKRHKGICYPSVFDKAWNKWLSLCSAGLGIRFLSQYLQPIFVSSPSDIQHLNLKPAPSENHQGCPCFVMISQLTDKKFEPMRCLTW